MGTISSIHGIKIYVTELATEHDGYHFPIVKNRSARVFKKLLKKFGSHEKRKPAAYKVQGLGLCMHPVLFEQMKKETP
jgi:hypothetical protein